MGLALPPGQLEQFIGTFYKVNAKTPPSKPEYQNFAPLERLVIAKGLLQCVLKETHIDVAIPEHEQVDIDTYQSMVPLLANQLANLLQVPEHAGNITTAISRGGLVAYFQGSTLRMNPLAESVGEEDRFD